jgi:hypothetical protein
LYQHPHHTAHAYTQDAGTNVLLVKKKQEEINQKAKEAVKQRKAERTTMIKV